MGLVQNFHNAHCVVETLASGGDIVVIPLQPKIMVGLPERCAGPSEIIR